MKWLINLIFIFAFYLVIEPKVQEKREEMLIETLLFQNTALSYDYMEVRLPLALALEEKYGVPYKVQIAIDIAESGYKENQDTSRYNNDCWITCSCNYNQKLRSQHRKEDRCFLAFDTYAGKYYYFKKYKTIEENWEDKAKIISRYKWFKPNQPFEWYAKRLQGCYAESNKYATSLNNIHKRNLANLKYETIYL